MDDSGQSKDTAAQGGDRSRVAPFSRLETEDLDELMRHSGDRSPESHSQPSNTMNGDGNQEAKEEHVPTATTHQPAKGAIGESTSDLLHKILSERQDSDASLYTEHTAGEGGVEGQQAAEDEPMLGAPRRGSLLFESFASSDAHDRVINLLAQSIDIHSLAHHQGDGGGTNFPAKPPNPQTGAKQPPGELSSSRGTIGKMITRRKPSLSASLTTDSLPATLSERDLKKALERDIDDALEQAAQRRQPASQEAVSPIRQSVSRFVDSVGMQYAVTALVVVNALIVGVETDLGPSGYYCTSEPQDWLDCTPSGLQWLTYVDNAIITVFNIELALKLFAHCGQFWKDGWNIFDFIVVVISDADLIVGYSTVSTETGVEVFRLLRVFRVFRLINSAPEVQELTEAFLGSMSGVMWVGVLMTMMFLVFAVAATVLFGLNSGEFAQQADYQDWFGNVLKSSYSLFQIMTLESWSMGIVREVMEEHSWSWLFFISWILLSSYGILNLLASIFVEKILEAKEKTMKKKKEDEIRSQENVDEILHDYFFKLGGNEVGLTSDALKYGTRKEKRLKDILTDKGWLGSGGTADTLFEILDINGDGFVDYGEFLNLAMSTKEALTKESVLQSRLDIKHRMDILTTELDRLQGLVDSVVVKPGKQPDKTASTVSSAESSDEKAIANDQNTETTEEKTAADMGQGEARPDFSPSLLISATTAALVDHLPRDSLVDICRNACILPANGDIPVEAADDELRHAIGQQLRQRLLWWTKYSTV